MQSSNSIDAAIFDLGGVIFQISFQRVFESWARSTGVAARVIAERFQRDPWSELFSRGEISPAQYRVHISELIGATLSPQDFEEGWNSIFLDSLPGIERLVQQLRQKLRLVILSNTNALHAREWRTRYAEVLSNFERVFASHEIGASKPQPEAYQIVLDYLKTDPERVVFFDDSPENVAGARRMGIRAFVATSPQQIAAELRGMGLEVRL
jgi:putative hydrolase of the HAD superfamily